MSSSKMRIATPADAARIAHLHAASWQTAYRGILSDNYLEDDVLADRIALWTARMNAPSRDQLVVVAEDINGELEGLMCVLADEDSRWGSLIDNLHVAPKLKRSGIGTKLMREGARWLQQRQSASAMYLWVFEANAPARRFYEKVGARNAETVDNEVAGGTIARSCRYVWDSPQALRAGCSDR